MKEQSRDFLLALRNHLPRTRVMQQRRIWQGSSWFLCRDHDPNFERLLYIMYNYEPSSNNTTFSERAANGGVDHVGRGDCCARSRWRLRCDGGAPTSFHLLPDTRLFARAGETCLWFE